MKLLLVSGYKFYQISIPYLQIKKNISNCSCKIISRKKELVFWDALSFALQIHFWLSLFIGIQLIQQFHWLGEALETMGLPRKIHQTQACVRVSVYVCGLRSGLDYKRPDFSWGIVVVTLATSDILRFLFLLSLFFFVLLTLYVAEREKESEGRR